MAKKKRSMRGTDADDVLTGSAKKDRIRGYGGDDIIESGEGKDKAWGGEGDDTFVTEDGGRGHVKIMDFQVGDLVEFCGCASTRVEQRGKNAWIVKGDDVKAVLKGIDADSVEINFVDRVISLAHDSLA